MTKSAIGYLRQSVASRRDATDGGSVSLSFQLDAINRWCDANDTTLLTHHSDLDQSGASFERAGLDAFIADIKATKPDLVIFWSLNRMVRNLRLFLDVFDVTEDLRIDLVSCREGSKLPAFYWKMLALLAEDELDRIASNITHGIRKSAERGRHHGYAPLGYLLDEGSNLVIDQETSWIVEWIFSKASQGWNPVQICRELNRTGVPTSGTIRRQRNPESKLGGSEWSPEVVRGFLQRRTYTGQVEAGRKSVNKHGRGLEVVVAEAPHPAIIDRETFDIVQRNLALSSKTSYRRGSYHWLSGRVTCAVCGSPCYYVDAGRTGKPYRDQYFRCRQSYKRNRGVEVICTSKPRISAALLDELVRDALSGLLSEVVTIEETKRRASDEQRADARTAHDILIRERSALEREQANFVEVIRTASGNAALQSLLRQISADSVRIEQRLAEIAHELTEIPSPPTDDQLTAALDTLTAIQDAAQGAPAEDMGTFASLVDLRVVVDLNEQAVELRFADLYRWWLP